MARPDTSVQLSTTDLVPLRRCSSLISVLASCAVHCVLLVVLTLLWMSAPIAEQLDIELKIANVEQSTDFETFTADLPEPQAPTVSLDASEPTESSDPIGLTMMDLELAEFGQTIGRPESGEGDAPAQASTPNDESGGKQAKRKGSFFGAEAYGDEFVFVVDNSSSMLSPCGFRYGHNRFQVACQELLQSIKNLDNDQEFCVFFFGLRTRVMFDQRPQLFKATDANLRRLARWIQTITPGEGTDPRLGVLQALRLKPAAIFLLSDGAFNGQQHNAHALPGNPTVEQIIRRHLRRSIPIHTFAFEDIYNRRRMRNIATATGGTHKYIGSTSEEHLLVTDLKSNDPVDVSYAVTRITQHPKCLSHDQYIQLATERLTSLLLFRREIVRESAHQAMLALADSLQMDTKELENVENFTTKSDALSVQKLWREAWWHYFREREAELQLTRFVVPQ